MQKEANREEIKNPKKRVLAWRRELKEHTNRAVSYEQGREGGGEKGRSYRGEGEEDGRQARWEERRVRELLQTSSRRVHHIK